MSDFADLDLVYPVDILVPLTDVVTPDLAEHLGSGYFVSDSLFPRYTHHSSSYTHMGFNSDGLIEWLDQKIWEL